MQTSQPSLNVVRKRLVIKKLGVDSVVRRQDIRGGTGMANSGFVEQWEGHSSDGEPSGVLGFMPCEGPSIVTARDNSMEVKFVSRALN